MLADRVRKARKLSKFARKLGERRWIVPGSNGSQNVVYRFRGTTKFECKKWSPEGDMDCAGNANGQICYHVIQAIVAEASREKGFRVSFSDAEWKARKLENFGGRAWPIYSSQGRGQLWVTASPMEAIDG